MRRRLVALCLALALPLGAAGFSSSTTSGRAATPEDRYAMAGGCYTLRSAATDGYVVRSGTGFAATGGGGGEPFTFQATDLGSYLLFGTASDFLAGAEGLAATGARAATGNTAAGIAGGLTQEQTDAAARSAARGPAGAATGRGGSIVAAGLPSEMADWTIDMTGANAFVLSLPGEGKTLVAAADGTLALASAPNGRETFGFHLATGCTPYPEIEVNVTGDPARGDTPFEETQGYLDAHLHGMAFEFIGGRSRCGKPWHRYGVAYALVDCPDHEPGGLGAALENVVSNNGNVHHDTTGWPTFAYWPKNDSLTHEQVYYKWLERAWRGGLRLMVNLLVDNRELCETWPYKKNSCNEMDGVRLQAQRLREFERYIDAQSGGPGEGWFRIVTDPHQARRVVNSGKLAVILGIEVSIPFDCDSVNDQPLCDEDKIDEQLDHVFGLGVRQMELGNKFDNALTGITGDSDSTGIVVNSGNRSETGHYWRMETCGPDDRGSDKRQYNMHDEMQGRNPFTERDGIFGAMLQASGRSGVAPVYPQGPHCNIQGLSALGAHAIQGLAQRGMIFDPDHMSARARHAALDVVASLGYSGVMSSHSWSDNNVYRRILQLGGVVTPHAGGASGFASKWTDTKSWADPRFTFGLGYGSDVNGFSKQGAPRNGGVTYPITGLGGVQIFKQVSGQRTYDVNTDGVAHYGLYPDWIEDLRRIKGDAIVEDMARGAEAYLQMWERATGIAGDACRADVADLTDARLAQVSVSMTPEQVLGILGQPKSRVDSTFTFCATAGRQATVLFDGGGLVSAVIVPS